MKSKMFLLIVLSIIGLSAVALLTGKWVLSFRFEAQVKELFSLSKNISEKTFQYGHLKDLPEPVQRYFKHVLKEGQPYISYARIKHRGQFRTGEEKSWMNITGEQYATTGKPGFIWKGTTTLFTARDMYIGDKGRLIVAIFSLFRVADAKGNSYNQGELLRWLGESVLYPTNLLPNENLQWQPIDASTAKLIYTYEGLSLYFIITFNDTGEMVQMETKRYMDATHLENWVIKAFDYERMNDILVPLKFEVLWRLPKGDFTYAKFTMTEIEYNRPEKF